MFTRRYSKTSQTESQAPFIYPSNHSWSRYVLIDKPPSQDHLPQTHKARAPIHCHDAAPAPHPWLTFNLGSLSEAQQDSLQVKRSTVYEPSRAVLPPPTVKSLVESYTDFWQCSQPLNEGCDTRCSLKKKGPRSIPPLKVWLKNHSRQ